MAPEPGAGGGGDPKPDPKGDPKPDPKPDHEAIIKALEARLAKLETKPAPTPEPDDDLKEKSRKAQAEKDQKSKDSKALESALKFSLGAKDWLKTNASLLPKGIEGIFTAAEKETYGDALEKDAAIKASIVQEFFAIQSNVDLLTSGPKSALDEFLKLTKNGKEDKAQAVYDQVFEPAFEMLKRIKKAEQLGKAGHATSTDSEKAYADKLMKLSRKHYMGEKADA